MRLLITADLHFNHGRGRDLALDAIRQINESAADALLVVGDTCTADEGQLESTLPLITFAGPKLFLCGNHELWTRREDSYAIFTEELPARVRALGWHWLEDDPVTIGQTAIVGSVGWYDYSYAPDNLHIPKRFYEAKISPGAAEHLTAYRDLFGDDVSPEARDVVARWNDGKFIKLGRSDEAFLEERMASLQRSLDRVPPDQRILAAVHHVPFEKLLPPRHSPAWDFARAYLGSSRMGELLLRDDRIDRVYCGHSHFGAEAQVGHIHAINIGSGYRQKFVLETEV